MPLTTLEISTLAYIPCACFVFWLWWDKPYDICVPTVLDLSSEWVTVLPSGQALIETDRYSFVLSDYRTYHMTRQCWEDAIVTTLMPINRSGFLSGTVFLVVGSIHLAAWNFDFPSMFEQWAWRVCAVVITISIPVSWIVARVVLGVAELAGVKGLRDVWFDRGENNGEVWNTRMKWVVAMIQGVGVALYAVARLYLLVEVFLSLRAVPKRVYETPDWTMFIPHVQ